jgi:hypothetical protein
MAKITKAPEFGAFVIQAIQISQHFIEDLEVLLNTTNSSFK